MRKIVIDMGVTEGQKIIIVKTVDECVRSRTAHEVDQIARMLLGSLTADEWPVARQLVWEANQRYATMMS